MALTSMRWVVFWGAVPYSCQRTLLSLSSEDSDSVSRQSAVTTRDCGEGHHPGCNQVHVVCCE
jgi:hypothetical protein